MANDQQTSSSSTAMIGSTTTFYEDSLQAPQPEPEVEYATFLEHFPQQNQYPQYTSLFHPYTSQPFPQSHQYLPTPSVSPTSASGRQVAAVPHQSPTQYYALNGAIEQIPKFEPTNTLLDNTQSIGKRERAGPLQRRKPQTKALPKPAASRKRPRKSADGTGRASPMGEESGEDEADEKTGDEPKPIQRL
jgi:hypothetical protein